MQIEVETNFIPLILAYDDLPAGVTKRTLPSQERRNLGDYSVAAAIFTIATGAVGGTIGTVFGSWLYDKLKNHKDKTYLKIDRIEVAIEKSEITRVIKEKIELKK